MKTRDKLLVCRRILLALLPLAVMSACGADIHLAGDSTLAPRSSESRIKSWGDLLRPRLAVGCQMHNYAVSGTSTVTFRSIWEQKLLGQVKEGDYVFIQFGHNDPWHTEKQYEKPDVPDRFCTPEQYESNLRRFIAEVRDRKGVPVLFSPTPSRHFDSKTGEWTGPGARHLAYFDRLPKIAASENVDFVDLTNLGGAVLKALGPEMTKSLFMIGYDGKDNTHPTEGGARIFGELVLADVRARKLAAASCFR